MQVQAAFLHVLGDLLSSVGVIVASVIMYIWPGKDYPWSRYADPTCTYIFALLVFSTTIPLFRKCLHIMMEGTPDNIDPEALKKLIKDADPDNICEIHDLHCWKLGGAQTSLSVHLRSHSPTTTLYKVTMALREKPFSLMHTTIQCEGVDNWDENKDNFACATDMHANDTKVYHRDH